MLKYPLVMLEESNSMKLLVHFEAAEENQVVLENSVSGQGNTVQ